MGAGGGPDYIVPMSSQPPTNTALRRGLPGWALWFFPALLALAVLAPGAAAQTGGGVLIVGDSLEVGTSPYLQADLPGAALTVDAEESRSSSTVLEALRENVNPSQSVVVFDAGTNDDPAAPDALAANLAAAAEVAGQRCMVVATINRPPYNGYGPDGLNAVVTAFAASRPGTQVVDWRSAALANPGVIYSDGVHPNASGYQLRAQLVARAIQACLIAAPGAAPATGPPATPPVAKPTLAPVPPPPEEIAVGRAHAASLVGAEVLGRLGRLLDRQDAPGMLLIASALLWRG